MSQAAKLLAAAALAAVAIGALYNEFILDIRAPRSNLFREAALGTSAYLSLVEYNEKVKRIQAQYGERGHVFLEGATGDVTVKVDDQVIERSRVERRFASMHGLFVISGRGAADSIFPFDIEPGKVPERSDREPNVARLKSDFADEFPTKYLAFSDRDWTRGPCAAPPVAELWTERLAQWLHLRKATFCVINWRGGPARAMLIVVLLADGDPWMRPFVRRICRRTTEAAIARAVAGAGRPDFAACVLVDRPARNGPSGAQDAFASVTYEVRADGLARID